MSAEIMVCVSMPRRVRPGRQLDAPLTGSGGQWCASRRRPVPGLPAGGAWVVASLAAGPDTLALTWRLAGSAYDRRQTGHWFFPRKMTG
jgi:hypothetical protein